MSPSGSGNSSGLPNCPTIFFLVYIIEKPAFFALPANYQASLGPFGMPANMNIMQAKARTIGMNGTWGVDALAAVAIPSCSHKEIDSVAISIPKRMVDE